MVIRFRKTPTGADPTSMFRVYNCVRYGMRPCSYVLDGKPLCYTPDQSLLADPILEPKYKYFLLHRLIGDVFWMAAAAEPSILKRYDDEPENLRVLSDDNLPVMIERLHLASLVQVR